MNDYTINFPERNSGKTADITYRTLLLPWNNLELESWSIVGMNHYHVKGVRHLFCAMVKDGKCITAEGCNEEQVFESLIKQAQEMNYE